MENTNLVPGFYDEKDNYLKLSLSPLGKVKNGITVSMNGYIDTYNSAFFQKQVTKVIDKGYTNIIFDCTALTYVSSTGIGTFTVFLKLLKPKGGDMVFINMQPKVTEVLQLLGFSEFFCIKDTADEAVAYLLADKTIEAPKIFPLVVTCPACEKRLRANHEGKFRCPNCKAILAVNDSGSVSLG